MLIVKSFPQENNITPQTGILVTFKYHVGLEPTKSILAVLIECRYEPDVFDVVSLDGSGLVWNKISSKDLKRWQDGISEAITNFQYVPSETTLEYFVDDFEEDENNDNP